MPAGPVEGGAPPAVGIVGDSISFEALEEIPGIVGAERPVAFHLTRLGVELRDIHDETIDALEAPSAPDILVLVIGTSQAQHDPPHTWRTDLRAFLDDAQPLVDCVRIFDIQERFTPVYKQLGKWGPIYNAITRDIVGDYAGVDYFHYSDWVDLTGPELDAGDGLHHNRAGERAVARLIRDVSAGCDPAVTSGPFWDVRDGFWAAEAIAWMGDEGHATGYPNGTYRATIGDYEIPSAAASTRRCCGASPAHRAATTHTRGPTVSRGSTVPCGGPGPKAWRPATRTAPSDPMRPSSGARPPSSCGDWRENPSAGRPTRGPTVDPGWTRPSTGWPNTAS